MIEKRTVFVLGAGASCPYGFPDARGLRRDILANFANGPTFFGPSGAQYADRLGMPADVVAEFQQTFDRSNTSSIDLFLSRHPRYRKIGKLAILASILWAEYKSCFGDHVKMPTQDWYFYLYNSLMRGLDGKDAYRGLSQNRMAFVTFNYDRSLEHFLFDSLLHSFEGAEEPAIREQMELVPTIHVYGGVAPLPWQADGDTRTHGYGDYQLDTPPDLLDMVDNLFVVHEQRDAPKLKVARDQIEKAEQIFFLGFGYAKENLEALGLPGTLRSDQRIYGTALGCTEREIRDVETFFVLGLEQAEKKQSNKRDQVKIKNCDCVALLREFL